MNASLFKLAAVRGAAVLGFGLVGVSVSPALACDSEAYIGSICMMASNFCPEGTVEMNGTGLPQSNNQALYSILGTIWGTQAGQVVLPNMQGRSVVGLNYSNITGQNTAYLSVPPGQSRGIYTRTLSMNQMPAHTHDATFNVTMPPNAVKMTMQANGAAGSSPKITSTAGYLAGGVGILPWTSAAANPVVVGGTNAAVSGGFTSGGVTNASTGTGAAFAATQPTLALTVCMVTSGAYPLRP